MTNQHATESPDSSTGRRILTSIRFTEQELESIRSSAAERGMSVSQYIRALAWEGRREAPILPTTLGTAAAGADVGGVWSADSRDFGGAAIAQAF